jgi:hypothetical protein
MAQIKRKNFVPFVVKKPQSFTKFFFFRQAFVLLRALRG